MDAKSRNGEARRIRREVDAYREKIYPKRWSGTLTEWAETLGNIFPTTVLTIAIAYGVGIGEATTGLPRLSEWMLFEGGAAGEILSASILGLAAFASGRLALGMPFVFALGGSGIFIGTKISQVFSPPGDLGVLDLSFGRELALTLILAVAVGLGIGMLIDDARERKQPRQIRRRFRKTYILIAGLLVGFSALGMGLAWGIFA